MKGGSMKMAPVRVNATHWVTTLFTAATMSSLWPPEIAAQEPADSVIPLDSVMVSVLRGAVGLDRAPYAVSVQSGQALQLGNTGFSLDEAIQGIPGLQIQNRYNYTVGERISIRGFGARSQFGARGIKILVDGIPATMADGQSTLDHLDIGSLGRVEVLRGPAAAIYGNGGGGVLAFETVEPPDVPVRQEAKAVFGDNGLMRFQSTTSGSQGGKSYLVNVSHLTYDGFRTVADSSLFVGERSDSSVYGLATRLNVNGQVALDAGAGRLRITANFFDLAGESAGGLNRTDMYVNESLNARSGGFGNVARNARKDLHQGQLGATWSGPVGGLNAEFVGWGLFRRMDNPIPPRIIDLERNAFGFRGAVATENSGDPGEVALRAGFDVDFQRDDRVEHRNNSGTRGTLTKDQFETVTASGLFLQATATLTERVALMGGLRYDRFDFGANDRLLTDGDNSGNIDMGQLSPTVGLVVEAGPSLSVFGNFATSLATPTTTELANTPAGGGGFNPGLNPQTGNTGEVGLRGQANWSHSRPPRRTAASSTEIRENRRTRGSRVPCERCFLKAYRRSSPTHSWTPYSTSSRQTARSSTATSFLVWPGTASKAFSGSRHP
jgi:iron complex outermembrane receptor protein